MVQLPQTDAVDRESVALQQIGYREDRADPHLAGITATHDRATVLKR